MGRYLFRLPDVGEGVAEAEVVVWHVKPGDVVKEDQSLVDVMTDKATVDMTSPVDGIVTAVHGEIGSMQSVGSVLVEIEVEGEGNAPADGEGMAPAAESTDCRHSLVLALRPTHFHHRRHTHRPSAADHSSPP